ncbi:DUF2330 domain-containing protein [candidate division TA06 bacterium]|uniref:DUF2330 domain-containing protein n=1 Tax=candidate division TA06 bacterium TaxID=2250710 RepID=A0A933MKX6_UNCT6|nr:DUF2330 domain-containing protein [candidate division TA06 bacterium]
MDLRKTINAVLPIAVWLAACPASRADMGAIVPAGEVQLSEPGQKAVILFSGQEEVLILATDLSASGPAKILRFIPLPGEPQVSPAAKDCFKKAAKLVKKHQLRYLLQYKGGSGAGEKVELLQHKRIGPHDVTVIRINDAGHFEEWVNEFFKSKGLPAQENFAGIREVVAGYLEQGIAYFVFDLVEARGGEEFIAPLQYRFKSDKLYYPLKTSNLFGGQGRIDLIFFVPCAWRHIRQGFVASSSARVKACDLKGVFRDSKGFFGQGPVTMQAFKYEGALQFDGDLMLGTDSGVEELRPYDPRKP